MLTFSGLLHGGADALEVADGANARVEIEHLPERDVERADSAAHGRRERSLDRDAELLHRVDGFLGQPILELLERFLAREDFHPGDTSLALVGALDRGVEDAHGCAPNVGAGTIALDEWDDGIVGHGENAVLEADPFSARRDFGELILRHWLLKIDAKRQM